MKPSTEKETLNLNCEKGRKDVVYLKKGWDFVFEQGFPGRMPRKGGDVECWADAQDLKIKLTCPAGASGKLILHIVDADNLGRVEKVLVDGREMGAFGDFREGKWIEFKIDSTVTQDGVIDLNIKPVQGPNAVVSNIRFEAE